ncbi:hypothetical protein JMJ55_05870 [Belnapia sp. T6]|uniref:DUF2306 domain-containing protein n=1 Tax=Belnapia mucosa TaxID=2804532 RepID=A0ABS1UZU9_9PROT|nr:hypothetical protein [Belnapia mucosa]MBL6454842.1 hypothetical protein [Belnapia mucosa]
MTATTFLLVLHIMGGFAGLLAGPVPMLAKKGGRLHRRAGWVFAGGMGLSALAAFPLALIAGNRLLLTIAVLTGFLVVTGMRAVRFRHGARPGAGDAALCLLLAGFGAWLLGTSLDPMNVTGLAFGAGSLVLAARQWRTQRAARPDWLLAHIIGMSAAYLATLDAFLVVNLHFLPKAVVFLAPSLLGTILIAWVAAQHVARTTRRAAA